MATSRLRLGGAVDMIQTRRIDNWAQERYERSYVYPRELPDIPVMGTERCLNQYKQYFVEDDSEYQPEQSEA